MESMVNLEKEFQNLYVQKNKKGNVKSVVKYFSSAQEKLFTSKSLSRSHSSSPKPTNHRTWKSSEASDANDNSFDLNNSFLYNEWAVRTCL